MAAKNSKFRKVFLYEKDVVSNLIPKLKPAFEENVFDEKELNSPPVDDLNNLTVSSTTSCSTCGISFDSIQGYLYHQLRHFLNFAQSCQKDVDLA